MVWAVDWSVFVERQSCDLLKRICALAALLIVAGCGSLPQAVIGAGDFTAADVTAKGAKVIDLYLATSRAPDENEKILFSGERANIISFTRLQVSIPPNHRPGEIERPIRTIPNPRTEFTILEPDVLPSSNAFIASLDADLARRPRNERDVLVFVHGYNTDLTSAIFRTAQFANDINYPGIPVLFSWASRGRTLDYIYDLNSALHARDALLETGEVLSRTSADGFNVVAHSMGTLLTVEAMRQAVLASPNRGPENFRVRNVALAAPDIDIDLFRRQLEVLPTTGIPIYVLVSDDDRALSLSTFIAGGRQRVGLADLEELTNLGVIVIDLSAVEDRDTTSHTKFANSPEVIRILGDGLRAGNTLETRTNEGFRIADLTGAPATVVQSGRALVFD
ncbi:MAG: alpha/beta fold hydrolase [Pseudomonadota bacterium]